MNSTTATFRPPNPNPNLIKFKPNSHPTHMTSPTVTKKLNHLVTEFKTLHQPIDRVKKLLHYASLLPEFNQSRKIESNRVTGCTTQVWIDATINDVNGMSFHADSDSEITKGFCYCLIWLLDGADGREVVEFRIDDLEEMNVGILPVRASSRVNTWHNVLISMQNRTRDLMLMQKYGGDNNV
ncbi:Fe-S metabolism associated domain, SufE-like protein [Artemisia annua]|uniref:Fe-S metabolism associated domain, SufE-like protein n=1 Tax=Artemisia annua TaxID=35608 RepID=A0A2U1M8T2_ARTAN|nr:Fe-S metabolism associated domain, SufE-like protein [Artemisia annua]